MEFLEKRRKFFARKREIEKRNRPPTKAQQRSLMCTYLRNMDGWKPKNLKKKSFDEIQKLFDSALKRVNTFVDINTEIVEKRSMKIQVEITKGSSKRAGDEPEQESAKRQRCLEIVPKEEDVAIKATPLFSKSSTIVDYKIYREGKKSYFKIIRADGNLQNYLTFETMFKNFNREDLEVLRSIIKERFKKTNPVDDMENLLFQTLKTMFEPHVEDIIWKYQQEAVKVNNWKLFYSCGVYCVTTKTTAYYLLVEKMYPFTNNVLHQLWSDVRLQVDYEVEMAYDLLRLIRRSIHLGSINYVPVIAGTTSNDFTGKGESFDAVQSSMETRPSQDYILMPLWNDGSLFDSSPKASDGDKQDNDGPSTESEIDNQERPNAEHSTKDVNTVNTIGPSINNASSNINTASPTVITVRQSNDFFGADDDMRSLDEVELDISNISTTYPVPTTLNTRINKDHSLDNVIGDMQSGVQTRRMTVLRNKKDERGIVIRNNARLVADGCTQEEGIDYDEVFALVARIEAIRLFLAYVSFMGFLVYQLDVKGAFLYGRIEEE
nr:copia protein [Tanacetum cinerariifolium]